MVNYTIETSMIAIAGITLLAVISPGPDFAIILRNSLRYGRRLGLATALGIACGVVVHVSWTLSGLTYLVARYAWLLVVVRYAGAAYLIWLGGSAFISRKGNPECSGRLDAVTQMGFLGALGNGFLCNVLNPKTVLFFVALFTQIVAPDMGLGAQVGIGIYIVLAHLAWFSFVVLVLTNAGAICRFNCWRRSLERVVGGCLLCLGFALAIER